MRVTSVGMWRMVSTFVIFLLSGESCSKLLVFVRVICKMLTPVNLLSVPSMPLESLRRDLLPLWLDLLLLLLLLHLPHPLHLLCLLLLLPLRPLPPYPVPKVVCKPPFWPRSLPWPIVQLLVLPPNLPWAVVVAAVAPLVEVA